MCAIVGTLSLKGQSLVFSNFNSTAGLTLNSSSTAAGTTGTTDGTVLRLVTASTNDIGSAFSNSPRTVTSGFSTAFDFRLSSRGGSNDLTAQVADGFVFVLQRQGVSAQGSSGEYLGYGGTNPIVTSLGIEFDTFKNISQGDPSSNHIGINLNGSVTSVATANITPDFDSTGTGTKWTSWIDYNGTNLEVRVSNTGVRPMSANLAYEITSSAFQSTLGNNTSAFIGFTAATGGAFANHDIIAWTFSDSFVASGVTAGSAIPEPADFALLASAAALVAVAVRRIRTRRRASD